MLFNKFGKLKRNKILNMTIDQQRKLIEKNKVQYFDILTNSIFTETKILLVKKLYNLNKLVNDKDYKVRLEIAKLNIDKYNEILLNDVDYHVRIQLAKNNYI